MAKKDKATKAAPAETASSAAPASSGPWECECAYENVAEDTTCAACDAPRPAAAGSTGDEDDPYCGYVVGAVLSVEPVAGRDNLKLLSVDIGRGEAGPLPIVTNAPNVAVGARIVVATIGAQCGDIVVKKANVGGVSSEGIVCDSTMLKWTGGGAGTAALLPAHFEVGSKPPPKRPRLDGN